MDELLTIAKVAGGVGGGTALLVWVLTRQHVLDMLHKLAGVPMLWRAQSADLVATKTKLLIEQEALLNAEQRQQTLDLRAEVAALRVEITDWMEREHKCREDVHELRNGLNVCVQQARVTAALNASLSARGDKADALLRAAERVHPEWFA